MTAPIVRTSTLQSWVENCNGRGAWATTCLQRHQAADWGDLEDEDKAANDDALAEGCGRLLSAYEIPHELSGPDDIDSSIWIITDDATDPNSPTTILAPSDY